MVYRNSATQDRHRNTIRKSKPACGICGKPIDYELKWPDKWCYVVDHKIPLKPPHNGPDTLENKQAAHNTCNSKKRARLYAPIVRRSGSLD